jgi:hypothetical protein
MTSPASITPSTNGSEPEKPPPSPETAESRELLLWQRKLLPFMSRFLVVLAIIFFAISLTDMYQMRNFIQAESGQPIRDRVQSLLQTKESDPQVSLDVVQQGLLLLEADALDKRYRQASALLMSRIWTRQLAFITGMVMAFIGAVFIIGKLSERSSDVHFGASQWKAGISSTSPGLILAFLGTLLIGIALVVQPSIEVQDRPVYFMTMGIVKNPDNSGAQIAAPAKPDPDPFGSIAPAEKPAGKTPARKN